MRIRFILRDDPEKVFGGDMTMSRLALDLARESFEVSTTALGAVEVADPRRTVLRKPSLREQAPQVLRSPRRSLMHTRFDVRALREHLARQDDDRFVAEHTIMAESFLGSRTDAAEKLLINSHVSQADVWRLARPGWARFEATRIERDEARVWQAARSIAVFDGGDARLVAARAGRESTWLHLTMPPEKQIDVASSGPNAIFLGNRGWLPNREAVDTIVRLWPRISLGIPGANLWIVGAREDAPDVSSPAQGIKDLSFVDDLGEVLGQSRCLVAPISTGGGVRVKLLEAAANGLPVVASPAGLGELGEVLPISACPDDDAFVDQVRAYLLDARGAAADGDRLYQANADRWAQGLPHRAMQDWLSA